MTPRNRLIASLISALILFILAGAAQATNFGTGVSTVCMLLVIWNLFMAWRAWKAMQ